MATTAPALVSEAEKTMKGGFFSCLAGSRRYDEASELYQQAATQFKLAKQWQEAGAAYAQCALCASRTGDPSSEASFHTEAGNALKRISSEQAVEHFEQAVAIHSAGGKFSQAGKLLVEMAEMLGAEHLDHKELKILYRRAVEMYELDDHGKSKCTACNLKLAEYCANDGEYNESIRIFESEGEIALGSTLLQYGAKDHFFRAGILHLVMGDSVTVNLALEKYQSLDPRFAVSPEGELLSALAPAFEATDVDSFTQKLQEFDNMSKLDAWKTRFLLKVKDSMSPAQQDDLDLT